MAKLIGASPVKPKYQTRKPIERKYFTKESIALCFENPGSWVQLSDELVDKSYTGSLERQAEKLGLQFHYSGMKKGTKDNGYSYQGIAQARYVPAESSTHAVAAEAEVPKKSKKAKKKAKAQAQAVAA